MKWSYVCRTLNIDAPWFGNTDIKMLFLFKRGMLVLRRATFFTICNCGFGIWVNFDAVLRFSFSTTCGIAVFGALTRPPLNKTIICSVVSLRTADAFPVVPSLPTGNASAVRRLFCCLICYRYLYVTKLYVDDKIYSKGAVDKICPCQKLNKVD